MYVASHQVLPGKELSTWLTRQATSAQGGYSHMTVKGLTRSSAESVGRSRTPEQPRKERTVQWNDGHFLKWVECQCILKAGSPDSRGAGEGTGSCTDMTESVSGSSRRPGSQGGLRPYALGNA